MMVTDKCKEAYNVAKDLGPISFPIKFRTTESDLLRPEQRD